jgi:hypothetical protein
VNGLISFSQWSNGYSAVGGQTFNPYGRKIFDTGGSSSGSGVAVAANYAAAAVEQKLQVPSFLLLGRIQLLV